MSLDLLDIAIKIGLAALLAGLAGAEREWSGHWAGLRTHMIIAVGAALLTDVSIAIGELHGSGSGPGDPGRIAAQIVSGIGFLGAGTILQSRGSVVGLTTAATMWVVAAIGMSVGAAEYVLGVAATVIVIVTLMLLPRLERVLAPDPRLDQRIEVVLAPDPEAVGRVERLLTDSGRTVDGLEVERREDHLIVRYSTHGNERGLDDTVRTLLEEGAVRHVRVV
jgi:putative Mg2+ transporter-C (MgtC) family protein